jgi:hypothetical protein
MPEDLRNLGLWDSVRRHRSSNTLYASSAAARNWIGPFSVGASPTVGISSDISIFQLDCTYCDKSTHTIFSDNLVKY